MKTEAVGQGREGHTREIIRVQGPEKGDGTPANMSVRVQLGEVRPFNNPFNYGLERRAEGGEVAVFKLFLCFAQSAFQVRSIEIVGSGVEGVFVFVAVVFEKFRFHSISCRLILRRKAMASEVTEASKQRRESHSRVAIAAVSSVFISADEDEVVVVLGLCSAHSRAPFPRAFGGGSKMRPPGIVSIVPILGCMTRIFTKCLSLGFSHKGYLGTQRLSFSS